jgi:hypothetical protein
MKPCSMVEAQPENGGSVSPRNVCTQLPDCAVHSLKTPCQNLTSYHVARRTALQQCLWTVSRQQSTSTATNSCTASPRNWLSCRKPWSSLPRSHKPVTVPYPEPNQSNTCHRIFKVHFSIMLAATTISKGSSCCNVADQEVLMHLISLMHSTCPA